MCINEDANLVALDLGLSLMYDLVNFSRDIAGTPFPSANTRKFSRISMTAAVSTGTHETSCPAFKGSLSDSPMMRVDWKSSMAMRGPWTGFMDARCVNYVIPRSRRHGGEAGSS